MLGGLVDSDAVVAGGGGGAAPTWLATDSAGLNASGSSTVTFTAVNIGSASADRIVVVLYNCTGVNANSVTVGGITATMAVAEGTAISGLQIWYAAVPSGTTANIVVSAPGGMNTESILVGRLTGVTATPTSTNTVVVTNTDPASISVVVPSTGFGIVGIYGTSTLTSWTNAAQDFKLVDASTLILGMAHDSLVGTNTVNASGFSGDSYHMVSASWGP